MASLPWMDSLYSPELAISGAAFILLAGTLFLSPPLHAAESRVDDYPRKAVRFISPFSKVIEASGMKEGM